MTEVEIELVINAISSGWFKLFLIGIWIPPLLFFVLAWIKTKTLPFQLPDDELFARAFGKEVKR